MKPRVFTVLTLYLSLSFTTSVVSEAASYEGLPHKKTLASVMPVYGVSAHRIQTALWREDFYTVAKEARTILHHTGFTKEERLRVTAKLREDAAWFSEADTKVHKSAMAIVQAAEKKDTLQVVKALGNLQEGCIACHSHYRARLRTK